MSQWRLLNGEFERVTEKRRQIERQKDKVKQQEARETERESPFPRHGRHAQRLKR